MKLTSMKDFVLEQRKLQFEDSGDESKIADEWSEFMASKLDRIEDYANFLNQPVTLGMFVPCDEEGNTLREPNSFNRYTNDKHGFGTNNWVKSCEKWEQANNVILFDFNKVFFEFIKGAVESSSNLTIEWLVNEVVCTLTPAAIKQIEL